MKIKYKKAGTFYIYLYKGYEIDIAKLGKDWFLAIYKYSMVSYTSELIYRRNDPFFFKDAKLCGKQTVDDILENERRARRST